MSKEKKRFPIADVGKACLNKWAWSTIWLNSGKTSSCHRVAPVPIDLNNFDNFHNLPKKIEDREKMLRGEWPGGDLSCQYCQQIEEADGLSDRLQVNDQESYETPEELFTNPTATKITPTIVEFFAENTCNLRCVYCNSELSSRIEDETKKYGPIKFQDQIITPVAQPHTANKEITDKFLDWLERNVQTLARLHLLGGETYIQHDLLEKVFRILERNPNPKLQLGIFSNFNAPRKHFYGYTNRIKELAKAGCLDKFNLTFSIDCWGPEQSYVRSGLNLDLAEEYFSWVCEQSTDWMYPLINQTITNMSIKTMPDLIKIINKHDTQKIVGQYPLMVTGHSYLDPSIFDFSLWEEDFEKIISLMREDTIDLRDSKQRMIGIRNTYKKHSQRNEVEIEKLHTYLNELDRRRGTDWKSLFPYLT